MQEVFAILILGLNFCQEKTFKHLQLGLQTSCVGNACHAYTLPGQYTTSSSTRDFWGLCWPLCPAEKRFLQSCAYFSFLTAQANNFYCGKPERIRFRSGIAFNTVGAVLESWFGLQGLPLGLPPTLLGGSVLFPCLLWFQKLSETNFIRFSFFSYSVDALVLTSRSP